MTELSRYEQETIINYNQEEQLASCYTHDKALIRKLDELAQKSSSITVIKTGDGVREYNSQRNGLKSARQRNCRTNSAKRWQREQENDLGLRKAVIEC